MAQRVRIDDLYRFTLPGQPAIAPDGSAIAYVLTSADREADRNQTALWLAGVDGRAARALTSGPADQAPVWSPDGSQLAFLRATDGPAQLWLLPAHGGEAEQVTTLPLGAGRAVWRPDGRAIAFDAPVNLAADRPADAPVVTDRLGYKADGAGLLGSMRSQVHLLDLDSGEVRQVTSGDWHASGPAWSPDGTRLAFSAGMAEDADLTMATFAYTVDSADAKARPRLVSERLAAVGPITWTPDAQALLVVGAPDMTPGHLGMWRLPLAGGEPVNLVAALDRNVMPGSPGYPGGLPQLAGDGQTVLFCVRDRGATHVWAVDVNGGEPWRVLGGADRSVAGLSVAGDTVAVVLGTEHSFGELVTVELASGKETTHTAHHPAELDLFGHEVREFTISDGTVVHGWLLRDPDRTGPLPLLLDIHGGPHNAWHNAADPVHLYHQVLAERGWAVLTLNPRGSDGYGSAFYTGVVGAWGETDARDFLEPLDALVAEGVADPARLAVAGYSYGGFMTCYLTSRDPSRFAAAVAGGVVSDLTSVSGTSDMAHFLGVLEIGTQPWADPARFAELSPLSQVDQVRTPTLIVHGASDDRCPVGQAEQWFTALRERGVPTRMVLYPGGSHLFILNGRPSHRADWNQRIVDWLRQYAGKPGVPQRVPVDAAHWQRRLTELATRHGVAGASLGILRVGTDDASPDERVHAVFGVLSKATGVAVTEDTVFQIGSITKVWTATVLMQLVDEGLLDLDAPVVTVLPELRVADADVTKQVTMRHLLTHVSGIDGDVFTDSGRGDDCLERYVELLADAGQAHPLGATWSYCNSGFVIAGRVIERLTGQTWDQAMRERLFTPLGLAHTVTLAEEAILHRAAVGHNLVEGELVPVTQWGLPRSLGPAGLINASASDVLAFARLHLTGGAGLLAESSVAAMAARHAELPDPHTLGDSWGLGWIRYGWDGHRLIGHDGNTRGQSAFLRLLPGQGLAVTLLTNGGRGLDLYQDLFREIFAELAGIAVPAPLAPAEHPPAVDIQPYLGTYERAGLRIEVLAGPRLRTTMLGELATLMPNPVEEFDLVPVADALFVLRQPSAVNWTPVTFYALPTGEAYLHLGGRASAKVA